MPRNGPRQFTRQLRSNPAGVSCAQRGAVQHTGIVDQRGQRTEPVDDCADGRHPPLGRRDVERYRDHPGVAECVDGGVEFVDEHVAGGHAETVCAQPRHDGRALSAGRAGDQRDTIRHRVASLRCSAAPRRSACDSEASVIISKTQLRRDVSPLAVAGVDARCQAGRRR